MGFVPESSGWWSSKWAVYAGSMCLETISALRSSSCSSRSVDIGYQGMLLL